NQETIPDASPQVLNLNHLEIQARPTDHDSSNALWSGNPPHWVQIYKSSDSQILRYLSDTYSGSTTECDDASRCLCELLQQYIELKVESDLEEIHTCFRILRRLSVKSELFLQVYNTTIPHLQMTVGEKYGGSLCF
nr:DNA repair protein REV1 isoform X1 [Tanacetum cinerariifolium]